MSFCLVSMILTDLEKKKGLLYLQCRIFYCKKKILLSGVCFKMNTSLLRFTVHWLLKSMQNFSGLQVVLMLLAAGFH